MTTVGGNRLKPRRHYRSPPLYGRRKRRQSPVDAFGCDVIAGPKGSGKSAVAVYRSYMFATGQARMPDGSCICQRSDCPKEWVAYTNMQSTWIDHPAAKDYGGGWARPMDMDSIVKHDLQKHCVVILDEGYQHIDARRGMQKSSIEITDEISQSRKSGVITSLTSISLDWIDKRIRGQARAYYNCWCPSRDAKYVFAVVTNVSVGHLPPWKRKKITPQIVRFDTWRTRNKYNTYDRVDDRETTKNAGSMDRQIFIRDPNTGEVMLQNVGAIVLNVMFDTALRQSTIHPEEIVDIAAEKGVPVSEGAVRRIATQSGFMLTGDGQIMLVADQNVLQAGVAA